MLHEKPSVVTLASESPITIPFQEYDPPLEDQISSESVKDRLLCEQRLRNERLSQLHPENQDFQLSILNQAVSAISSYHHDDSIPKQHEYPFAYFTNSDNSSFLTAKIIGSWNEVNTFCITDIQICDVFENIKSKAGFFKLIRHLGSMEPFLFSSSFLDALQKISTSSVHELWNLD